MNDQMFHPHTPSFGDDEFDIGTIGLMNCPAPPDDTHHHQHAIYSSHHSHLGVHDHPSLYAIQPSMYVQQTGQNHHHQDGSYVLQTLESHSSLGSNNPMNTWSPARNMQPSAPSPMDPHVASPSNDTSEDSGDDSTPIVHVQGTKRPSPEPNDAAAEAGGRAAAKKGKPQQQKKKKRRDPHEPQKPVSAYALFFRDTQAAIKGQNPNASFGEVSKIVASMWDALDAESKNIYKRKTEAAKKEYLKALAAYRASVVSKGGNGNATNDAVFPNATPPNGNTGNYPNYQPNYSLNQHYNTTVPSSVAAAPQQQQQQQPATAMTKKTPLLTSLMSDQQQQQQQKVQQANVMQNYGSAGKTYLNQGQPQQIMMQATAQHIHHSSIQQMSNFPAHMQQQHQQQQQQHMSNGHQSTQSHAALMTVNSKHGSANLHNQLCIRAGCPNAAISSPDWENEYCSNECVVNHCRDVFSAWVAANPSAPPGYPAPVK